MGYGELLHKSEQRTISPAICVYIDANGLHELNNERGHEAGDLMLRFVAESLMEQFPKGSLYRVGGDEFVVFPAPAEGQTCEDRMRSASASITAQGYSISYGIAAHESVVGLRELVREADEKMLESKLAYCAEHDIIAGSSGRFRPADHVTIRELAKMLLVILGEDASRYVGASWAQNVDEDAFVKGIYAGVSANYDSAATRDTACLLIYNAMLCPKVADASLEGDQRYVLDGLMNPMSYLEIRFGLTRYTATLTGNECADLTSAGNTLSAGTSKLAGHKAFDISTDLSLLGRNVDIYVKDGTVFGIPCYAVDEVYYTFTDASQLKEICAGGGFRLTEETAYYYNYTPSNKDILNTLSENDKITVIDHDGDNAFDVVLVTTSYPATVTSVSPLTVDVDGETQTVRAFSSTDVFTVGEAVYYSQICGNGYIRRLS